MQNACCRSLVGRVDANPGFAKGSHGIDVLRAIGIRHIEELVVKVLVRLGRTAEQDLMHPIADIPGNQAVVDRDSLAVVHVPIRQSFSMQLFGPALRRVDAVPVVSRPIHLPAQAQEMTARNISALEVGQDERFSVPMRPLRVARAGREDVRAVP